MVDLVLVLIVMVFVGFCLFYVCGCEWIICCDEIGEIIVEFM